MKLVLLEASISHFLKAIQRQR